MPAFKTIAATLLALVLMTGAALAGEEITITVAKAWARATPGGATVGAAYAEIVNTGTVADKLTGVSTPAAARAEIHTHAEENGVMKMRRIEALEIAPAMSAVLAPGGHHIMLIDLAAPLKAGERLTLAFTFEKAGMIVVEAPIAPIGASGPSADGAESGSGSGSGSHDGSGSQAGSEAGSGSGAGSSNGNAQ